MMKFCRALLALLWLIPNAWTQTQVNLEEQVRGRLPVSQGGTGAADDDAARANLGLTTEFLAEDHFWTGAQQVRNLSGLRFAHTFAASGSGTQNDPWEFASGNPWAEAIADGGQVIILRPGTYRVTACPALISNDTTVLGLNRFNTVLLFDCAANKNRLNITGAANTSPIEITTAPAHGLSTGQWVDVEGVPGNTAANGRWQVTVVDSARFTLNGSEGNGEFVATNTGMWASPVYPISDIVLDGESLLEVTAVTDHNIAAGDRVLVEDVSGGDPTFINGQHFAAVPASNKVTLLDSVGVGSSAFSGGFVRAIVPVNGMGTTSDARGVQVQDLTLTTLGGAQNYLANLVSVRASESKFSGLRGQFIGPQALEQAAPGILNSKSASITFTGPGTPGDTVTLELTGGGSRASGPYDPFTVPGGPLPDIDNIVSNLGAEISVNFVSGPQLEDGATITISSTPETDAAGASGTFKVSPISFQPTQVRLIGSSGTGDGCGSGCGGADAEQSLIDRFDLARKFTQHLNNEPDFQRDYHAVHNANIVYLISRRFGAAPATMNVTANATHTTTPFGVTGRGGNVFLKVEGNSFSAVFERILCPGVHGNFHCIALEGINNQHALRDIRFSGGFQGGWAFRFSPGSNIQQIHISNVTAEAVYGAADIASMVASSITGLYMEAATEFGVRFADISGVSQGTSFVHANTVSNSFLLGVEGLELWKGRDLAVENSVIPDGCSIGPFCENCMVRSSWSNGCENESLSGYKTRFAALGQGPQPVDRYGERLSTDVSALLSRAVTNHALQSEDLTAPVWDLNTNTALVSEENPFGQTQLISRASVPSPSEFDTVTVGQQFISGLIPDARYGLSYWVRVTTPDAACELSGEGTSINRRQTVSHDQGWTRIAGQFQASSSGDRFVNVRCVVRGGGLADFTADIWGVMAFELSHDGALPPYIPTQDAKVTVQPGAYAARGELSGLFEHMPRCRTFTVDESQLTAAAASQDVNLFSLPARGVVTGVTIKHSAPFTGGSLTGMTASVGDASDPAAYAPAFDVFQPVSDTAFQDTPNFKSTTFASSGVAARFTASGDDVANATGGAAGITVCWAERP